MASCFGWVLTQGTVTLVLVKIVCKTLCVCVCANTSILCAYVSVFVIYWDTRGPDCPWNIGHTPTLSSLAFCPAWKEDRTRMKCERRSLFLSPRLLSLDLFKKKIFCCTFHLFLPSWSRCLQSSRLLRYSRFMSPRRGASSQPITAQCNRWPRLSMSRRKCSTATSWAEPEFMV